MKKILNLTKLLNRVSVDGKDMQLLHVEIADEVSNGNPSISTISFKIVDDAESSVLCVMNINSNEWMIDLRDGTSIAITSSISNILENQLKILKKHIKTVELALIHITRGEAINQSLYSLTKLACRDNIESINFNDLASAVLTKKTWSSISPSIAKVILDLLNRDTKNTPSSKFRFDMNSEFFEIHNNLLLDEELLRVLSEEHDLLSTMKTPDFDVEGVGLYKAVIKEALDVISTNVDFNTHNKLISGIELSSLRKVGLSYKDIDRLDTLSLSNLDNIEFEDAKNMSTYKFSEKNIESFKAVFKPYENLNSDESVSGIAVLSVEFGGLNLELNVDKLDNGNLCFEYYLCGRFEDPDGRISWTSIDYTGIIEDLDKLLKVEDLEAFERELFYAMIEYSSNRDVPWYRL